MAEIVNLRRKRKEQARTAQADKAAANRAKFGRPLAERKLESALNALAAKNLNGHRLTSAPEDKDG